MRQIRYKCQVYESLKSLANSQGVAYQKLKYRIDMGWPESRWFEPTKTNRFMLSEKKLVRALDELEKAGLNSVVKEIRSMR